MKGKIIKNLMPPLRKELFVVGYQRQNYRLLKVNQNIRIK